MNSLTFNTAFSGLPADRPAGGCNHSTSTSGVEQGVKEGKTVQVRPGRQRKVRRANANGRVP
ncbi:hypothetical protein C4K04_5908 [Pseudomonas chlororaphis]|uniref:Uncharacterized protein n=1 Tax=Pseudomonas chlororaphis TaxID=587753 RepID=A0A3G7TWP9_9PSED|nr:hypothetical protein C4K04_5908 [Pseudomonas chlororaphis]